MIRCFAFEGLTNDVKTICFGEPWNPKRVMIPQDSQKDSRERRRYINIPGRPTKVGSIVINGGTWAAYEWPKMNGLSWGKSTCNWEGPAHLAWIALIAMGIWHMYIPKLPQAEAPSNAWNLGFFDCKMKRETLKGCCCVLPSNRARDWYPLYLGWTLGWLKMVLGGSSQLGFVVNNYGWFFVP